jgi:hypothetical protein
MFQVPKVPNLALPRVQAKCNALLELVDELELYGPRQISQVELTKLLGNQAKPVGQYLRLGLSRFGSYSQETGKSYSYRPNTEFCEKLRAQLSTPPTPVLETAKRVNLTFLVCSRESFKKTGHRYYPWWSWMKTDKLEKLFIAQFGEMFRYDMEASQPTVILQLYQQALTPTQKKFSEKHAVPTWSAYVADRTAFRTQLARDLDEPLEVIKDLLQSITNGGYATTSPKNPMCRLLGLIGTDRLMKHPLYIGLVQDYRTIRSVLFPGMKVKGISRALYTAYERVEDAIMTVVAQELQVPAWFIHDGFFTHTRTSKAELEAAVLNKLNLKVKFEEKTISHTGAGPL